jgi:hypothetical protein
LAAHFGTMYFSTPGNSNELRMISGNNTQRWYTTTYAP